jgi:hypothetical protein
MIVEAVFDHVSRRIEWEDMSAEWNGRITKEAIAEAMQEANQVLRKSSEVSDGSP